MADHGVAVTWGDSKPGREKKAIDVFAEATTNNDKAVANGKIESWDVVFFEPSGTPPAGVQMPSKPRVRRAPVGCRVGTPPPSV